MNDCSNNNENDDEDELTSLHGEELMFGLDFSAFEVTDAQDEVEESATDDRDDRLVIIAKPQNSAKPAHDTMRVDTLLNFQDSLPLATETEFEQLFEWAAQQGARLDGMACRKDQYGGRGLYAARPVPLGGVLAMLPRSLRIGQSLACRTLGLPMDTPDLSALSLLVVWFCHQENAYAKCLPRKSEFTNALLMTSEQHSAWSEKGSEYDSAIRRVQSMGQACVQYIADYLASPSCVMPDDATNLFWAISMVKSRSHAFGSKRGYWLTPVFDLVNHSLQPTAVLEGDDQGCLVLKALEPIAQDQEITIDYQVEEDALLVANYGFSLKTTRLSQ